MSSEIVNERPIEGKVASVLNERELAINMGATHGVKVGMKFKILAESPDEIRDPASNELLGFLDREKVRVEVTEVQEKFAVCKTYRKKYTPGGRFYNALASATLQEYFQAPREQQETLKATDADSLPPLSEEASYVKKGDRAIQLMRDDN